MVPSDKDEINAAPGRKSNENRSVHGYQWTWNLVAGVAWKRCRKIILSGRRCFEIAVVKTERGKNLSAEFLFYPGFCSGVSGE